MAKCYVLLLGGIGSGKSSVGRLLVERDAQVIDADLVGHQVLETEEVRRELEELWPSVVMGNRVDRRRLASVVFADESQLRRLEAITHPRIKSRLAELISTSDHDLVVVEMPVLLDLVEGEWVRVVVDVPDVIRLRRLVDRGMAEDDAQARMRSQPSRTQYAEVADFVIDNSGIEDDLATQVDALVSALSGSCARRGISSGSPTESMITRTVSPWTRNQ